MDTPTSSVWSKIRKLLIKSIPQDLPSLVVNNNLVSVPKEAVDVLAENFSKISSKESFSHDFKNATREKEYPDYITNNSAYYNLHLPCKN